MRAATRIDLGPARLVSGRPGGLGGRASLRGRAGPALAGGFERGWAGSTDIFKVLSNLGKCEFKSSQVKSSQVNRLFLPGEFDRMRP
jgi:hypothetical protein